MTAARLSSVTPRTRSVLIALALVACSLAASCRIASVGPRLEQFPAVVDGRGATTHVALRDRQSFSGELLEVRDSAILVLSERRVILVPFTAARSIRVDQVMMLNISGGRVPPATQHARLAQVARWSAGAPPEALQRVLEAHGQTAPVLRELEISELDVEAFLSAARQATARYHDRANAVADGFRRVGPSFPGMGEHWVQPGRLVSGQFEVRTPPILTYDQIGGRTVLLGAAYTLPLRPGEETPAFPYDGAWHEHSGTVDEESLLLHALHGSAHTSRLRLAMLHAWIWHENPAGVFAQDNWALPFARLGAIPAGAIPAPAARAASLAAAGGPYYLEVVSAVLGLDAEGRRRVQPLITESVQQVRDAIADPGFVTNPNKFEILSSIWSSAVERWASVGHASAADQLKRTLLHDAS